MLTVSEKGEKFFSLTGLKYHTAGICFLEFFFSPILQDEFTLLVVPWDIWQ